MCGSQYILMSTLLTGLGMLLGACGGSGCGGGAADICPPPTYGYARVEGTVLRNDGTPAAGRQAFVSCGDLIGGYGDHTDNAGRFAVNAVYGNEDTLFHPHPPRDANGSFLVDCSISAEVRRDTVLRDAVVVPFAQSRRDIVPVIVELREASP